MLRSELAGQAACSPETVRYYEHIGLIEPPPRTAAGYRQYSEDHLRWVCFIRAARSLGFDLGEIRRMLALARRPDASCRALDALTEVHLRHIDEKIVRLRKLRRAVARLLGTCDDDRVATCKIVEALCEEDFLAVSEEVHVSPARRMGARKQPRNP